MLWWMTWTFYIEKINPNNPRQYWYKDHWEDMKVKVETIRVKGKEPVKTEILLTRHGPVVTGTGGSSKETVFLQDGPLPMVSNRFRLVPFL